MDEYYESRPRLSLGSLILNILTFVILLATLFVSGTVAALLFNPYLPFNPYPPPTLPPTLGPPTATNTPEIYLPATWTPTPTRTPTPTLTPIPTPTPTETPPSTEETPSASATGAPFVLQAGSPVLIPNIANDQECNWMGVGGQVFDITGAPITGLAVHLEGQLAGLPVNLDTLTGSASNLGPAGYVFNLSDHPIASEGTLWIQLNDTAGVALSDKAFLNTSDSCEENLVLVNWSQTP